MAYIKRQDLLEFAATLARELPNVPLGVIVADANALVILAAKLGRLGEDQCNRPELYEGEYDKRAERLYRACLEIKKRLGIEAQYQGGDPRGAAIRLHLPSGKTNDWGASGYCVPQA